MLARTCRFALLVAVGVAGTLVAQWPATSAPNLPIGDSSGEQTLAKLAATPDGGCWLAWFDQRGGNYAVYVQRLDAAGSEQFAHGGLLVSGNPQNTSLVDWDLVGTSQGDCVLTFTDTRAGGDLDVYAYRIATNGTLLWGANGVALSNNADYEANPRVCEANDGDFVFVWPNSVTRTIQLQRLDPAGNPRFPGDGLAIPGETGATPGFARVVAGGPGTGDVIVSWVRTTLAVTGPRHVHAQKFDASGNALWNGGTRLAVFDQEQVPLAYDPPLVSDRSGGAIVAWHYAQGALFSVMVQHLTAGGTEAFGHGGHWVSLTGLLQLDPAIVWSASTNEIFVAWNERNGSQSAFAIVAQKIDATGALAWGPYGITLLPMSTVVRFAPVAAPLRASEQNDGLAISVLVESLGLLQKSVQLFGLTNAGTAAFPPVIASTFASDKLRLAQAATASGTQLLVWTDRRLPGADVYGAAVDAGGTLGVTLAAATAYGCSNPPGSLYTTGRPAFGTPSLLWLTNPLGTQAIGTAAIVFLGLRPAPGMPCGVPLPGFGMTAGQPGELLLDLTQPYAGFFAGGWLGPLNPAAWTFAAPFAPGLLGQSLYTQGLLVDPLPPRPYPSPSPTDCGCSSAPEARGVGYRSSLRGHRPGRCGTWCAHGLAVTLGSMSRVRGSSPFIAIALLVPPLVAQSGKDVPSREAEVDKQVTPMLVAFARTAESYKAPSRARLVFEQIVEHYDSQNATALTGLGYQRVKGEWRYTTPPDKLPKDTATVQQLRSVEEAWKVTQKRVGKLHRELGLALLAEGVEQRGRYQLSRAIAIDPSDVEAHKALGHEELDGFFGTGEQIAFVRRMREITAKARELSQKDFEVNALPASSMPSELKKSELAFHGVRSKNFTHWVIGGPEAAASTAVWAERAFAMLDFLLGKEAPRLLKPRARSWLAIVRTKHERDVLLAASPSMLGDYTPDQARMLGGNFFKTSGVWAEYSRHPLEHDADHVVGHVAKRCWAGYGNSGLSEGLVHGMTWLLCGTTESAYCSLPSTVSGGRQQDERDPTVWLSRLQQQIAAGEDWPLVQIPREHLANFRDEVRFKSWSFVRWLLARYPESWASLFEKLSTDRLSEAEVAAAFDAVFGCAVGEVEVEWREWARAGSPIGEASR